MDYLFDEAVGYLYERGKNEDYEMFTNFAVTEKIIPESAKAIKNYVLVHHNAVINSNNSIRLISMPLARCLSNMIDPNIISSFDSYFKAEHELLILLKKLLKSKNPELLENIPMASGCGIVMRAIGYGHLENTSNLTTIINTFTDSQKNGYSVFLPDKITTPVNMQLVKKLTPAINNRFYNKE